jgi:hypothetical protein
VQNIFQNWKTPWLRGHLIWMPMRPADTLDAAVAQEALFQDPRVSQYWDGERALGALVSGTLELTAPIAWDMYLIYPPGATWKGDKIPIPGFWMHQMDDERPDLLFDPEKLKANVQKAIEATLKENSL